MNQSPDILHHAALDARMVKAARGIKLLGLASWPAVVQGTFLEPFARRQPRLPRFDYGKFDFGAERRDLDTIAAAADSTHPPGHYLIGTTRSWVRAAQLLEALGTVEVTSHSLALFGAPDQALPGNGPSTREAARIKRISLRIEAIALALDGADFIEVFRSAAARRSPRTPCTCAG